MFRMLICCVFFMPATLPAQEKPGVVFVAGGAGSFLNLAGMTRWALRQHDIAHEVRTFDWSHGKGRVIRDIQDIRHLVDKASELSQLIREYHKLNPGRPVYLLGRSTGAMVVLLAAEQLPAESIERIILLSPAVSPNYDLVPAMKATRREIVNFHSRLDVVVLDWGTSLVGTADRYYSKSAGLQGFIVQAEHAESAAAYQRLRQVAWSPAYLWYGHLGGHFGNGMPLFLLKGVAPLFKHN